MFGEAEIRNMKVGLIKHWDVRKPLLDAIEDGQWGQRSKALHRFFVNAVTF